MSLVQRGTPLDSHDVARQLPQVAAHKGRAGVVREGLSGPTSAVAHFLLAGERIEDEGAVELGHQPRVDDAREILVVGRVLSVRLPARGVSLVVK